MIRRPPRPSRTDTLFPDTPRFRPPGLQAHQRRRVASGEDSDPGAVAHDVDALGGHPLVVVAEAPERAGQRGVGRDVHQVGPVAQRSQLSRSEEHTSELQSLMRISSAVFCLKNKTTKKHIKTT